MPYAKVEDQRRYNRDWTRTHREKAREYDSRWRAKGGWEKKLVTNRKARGEIGSAKREAYNERRRARYKAREARKILAELEASRKHRESLREFITRKVA